jgi:predicted alpha/beta superfamily hydrolase
MKNHLNAAMGFFDPGTSLQQLVSTLINSSLTAAAHNKTKVMNEVEQGVVIFQDDNNVIAILHELLDTVVQNSRCGDIHITAERYSGVVIVEIQERNNYNGYALAFSIGSIEPDAALVGGHISIKGKQQKVATISFSFPDNLLVA